MALLTMALLLGGCMNAAVRPAGDVTTALAADIDCAELEDGERLKLGLIEDELKVGRPRAAMAHLDALPEAIATRPLAQYLRAESHRQVQEYDPAVALYRRLSEGCLPGAGHHGLGLVAAAHRDLDGAVEHLRRARELLAADPRVRNDYGYALLLSGRPAAARVEFETALELSAGEPRAARNLLLAMLVAGEEQAAQRYGRSLKLSDAETRRLQRHAMALREQVLKESDHDEAVD
ncbi:MAG: hypothetical protein CMN57_00380 [Gammaproteobacteria bacterium]|nr:hypothetical protein [Gammaproteobacteria bacterium]